MKLKTGDFAMIVERPELHHWSAFSCPKDGVVKIVKVGMISEIPQIKITNKKYHNEGTEQMWSDYLCEIHSYALYFTKKGGLRGGLNTIHLSDYHLRKINSRLAYQIISKESESELPDWHYKELKRILK